MLPDVGVVVDWTAIVVVPATETTVAFVPAAIVWAAAPFPFIEVITPSPVDVLIFPSTMQSPITCKSPQRSCCPESVFGKDILVRLAY